MPLREYKADWQGITYPEVLQNDESLKVWKRQNCKRGMHLFDEYSSSGEHKLYCDACGLTVHIAGIETEKQACDRVKNDEQPTDWVVVERASVEGEIEKKHWPTMPHEKPKKGKK